MRPKDSRPVWGEGAGKVPDGNSPTPYSTARRDLRGGTPVMAFPTATKLDGTLGKQTSREARFRHAEDTA